MAGLMVGVLGGPALTRIVGGFVEEVTIPGVLPIAGAAIVLAAAAVVASLVPASRAARVDVMEALRSE